MTGDCRPTFSDLVERYQDMACACAYAVLGNFCLAEEVAQEAFITAWQKLDQLRDPRAFPAWLRAIVLSHCHRITRRKRLVFVPIDGELTLAASAPDPEALLSRQDTEEDVRALVRALPEGERLVTVLHYMAGYSLAEVAQCLGLLPATVGKRLFSARRRLRRRALDVCTERMQSERPSRDRRFVECVVARLRPLLVADWASVTALAHLHNAADSADCEMWLRARRNVGPSRVSRQYIVERSNSREIVAYGAIEQSLYSPRCNLFLLIDPQVIEDGPGEVLLTRLIADARELNAVKLSFTGLSRAAVLAFLQDRGFDERNRIWNLRLEIAEADLSWTPAGRARITAQSILLSTLAEEQKHDPKYAEKLHDLFTDIAMADPAGRVTPPAFNLKESLIWLAQPHVLPDGYFIAKKDGRYLGVSTLNPHTATSAEVMQGFTGVRSNYRRRGIATALKSAVMDYALHHHYKAILASNHASHTAMVALNERLQFRRQSCDVTLEMRLRKVARLDSHQYAAYVGRYAELQKRPDVTFLITAEDGRLFAEFIGQKVELLPASNVSFFIEHFYGSAEFVLDANGAVSHLSWQERQPHRPEVSLCLKRIDTLEPM